MPSHLLPHARDQRPPAADGGRVRRWRFAISLAGTLFLFAGCGSEPAPHPDQAPPPEPESLDLQDSVEIVPGPTPSRKP